jgi:hypothetical protein
VAWSIVDARFSLSEATVIVNYAVGSSAVGCLSSRTMSETETAWTLLYIARDDVIQK